MAKFLFLLMLISSPTFAQEVQTPAAGESSAIMREIETLQNAKTEPAPVETILHTVEKKLVALPECNEPKLMQSAQKHIKELLDKAPTQSTLFRRRRHFILKSLESFTTENVADYKTSAQSPVSDIIADLKINGGVLEENMRLCKNENVNPTERPLYLLIWPEGDNKYKVQVINLSDKPYADFQTTFVYEQ